MAYDYQTRQGDDLRYCATTHQVKWLFDLVIISSLMINKKTLYLQLHKSYGW